MKCFKRPLRMKNWAVHKLSSGLRCSKEEKWALKIVLILGARQQVVPTRMSKKFESKSTRIVGTQVTRSQKLQLRVGVPVSRFWPWVLTWDELPRSLFPACSHRTKKNTRLTLCQELKNQIESDPNFLSKVITGDESWCYGYDPETKQASSQWKTPTSPRPKKARQVRSNVKKMLIVFFNVRGIVHRKFFPPGPTVNQEFYLKVLKRLQENVRRKRPELWRSGDGFLHHDNAPAHTALSVTGYLASLGWIVVPHLPYSPDLAPCHFFLFPTMKKTLKKKRFATVEDVKTASQEALNNIKLQQFHRCSTQWGKRLDKCIASSGGYFEGD